MFQVRIDTVRFASLRIVEHLFHPGQSYVGAFAQALARMLREIELNASVSSTEIQRLLPAGDITHGYAFRLSSIPYSVNHRLMNLPECLRCERLLEVEMANNRIVPLLLNALPIKAPKAAVLELAATATWTEVISSNFL